MTSVHTGQRALSISANVMMASAAFIKDTGCTGMLYVLLFGLLLPSVSAIIPSSSTTASMSTAAPTTTMAAMTTTGTTQSPTVMTTGAPAATTNGPTTTVQSPTVSTATPTAQPATSTTVGGTTISSTTQSVTTITTSGGIASTQSPTPAATSGGTASTTQSPTPAATSGVTASTGPATQSPTTTSGGIATSITSTTQSGTSTTANSASTAAITTDNSVNAINPGSTSASSTFALTATTMSGPASSSSSSSSSSMTSNSGPWTSMMSTTPSSNSTCGMTGMNGTTMMYCPSFTCNYTDCYTMYTSQNTTLCADGVCLCQLIKQTDMCYTVGCSLSCADSCVNASQTNCSVYCCNSTGCLNSTFASMMMMNTTTVMPTTTTKPTMKTTILTTTADKGNKCHVGSCTGTDCYKTFQKAQTCTSSQPHCQLKKEKKESVLKWTAGCTTNCSAQTPCKASIEPPCHLECCNATMTSCLWLNGTLNVPNFSTRGPHLHTELVASLFCLLAINLLL
ncbi:cell wall protein DAN4 [Trematomus bernacchii]|uniref:cell wall protein DAN4 n=1 Tax=Trematomus bernacchii TaxID=40690 RepID=UPI00146D13AE|nr:cell wall protein DAN4 [Trematomus bernacchii]